MPNETITGSYVDLPSLRDDTTISSGKLGSDGIIPHYGASISRSRPGRNQAREIQVSGTSVGSHRPIIYGTRRVTGTIFGGPFGASLQSLDQVLIAYFLCEGPVATISDVRVNGLTIADPDSPIISITGYLGTDTQAIDPLMAAQEPDWSSFPGSVWLSIVYNTRLLTNGFPQVTAVVDKGSILDWNSVSRPTANPVVAMYEYMTNKEYGWGIPSGLGSFHGPSWDDISDWCDELVNGIKRWQCNALLTGLSNTQIVRELGTTFFAFDPFFLDGLWRISAYRDKPTAVISLDRGDLAQPPDWAITPASSRPTTVRATFIDNDDWTQRSMVAELVGIDPRDRRIIDFSLTTVSEADGDQTVRWADQHLNIIGEERLHGSLIASTKPIDVVVGDRIDYEDEDLGPLTLRVIEISYRYRGYIELRVQLYSDDSQTQLGPAPAKTAPAPPSGGRFPVPTIDPGAAGLVQLVFEQDDDTVFSSTSGIFITVQSINFDPIEDGFYEVCWALEVNRSIVNGEVEVQVLVNSVQFADNWRSYSVSSEFKTESGSFMLALTEGVATTILLQTRRADGGGTYNSRREYIRALFMAGS